MGSVMNIVENALNVRMDGSQKQEQRKIVFHVPRSQTNVHSVRQHIKNVLHVLKDIMRKGESVIHVQTYRIVMNVPETKNIAQDATLNGLQKMAIV